MAQTRADDRGLRRGDQLLVRNIGISTAALVPKAAANTPSRRISERQGMLLVETKESDYVSGRLPTEIWEITLEEWKARCK